MTRLRLATVPAALAIVVSACGTGAVSSDPAMPSPTGGTVSPPASSGHATDELGPGASLTIEMIGQTAPNVLQYTEVELPYVNDTLVPKSNGRLTVNLTTRDERGLTGQELVRLVSDGQVDIAYLSLTFVAGDYPILDGPDLAGLNPTAQQAKALGDAWIPTMNEAIKNSGVTFLVAAPVPAQVFWCRESFTGLSDLSGRSIRTFGVTLNDLVEHLGAQPVSIAFAEAYSALERGVVNCAITGTATGNSNNWFEVTDAYMDLYLLWATSVYSVNTGWWEGLEPDMRDFLTLHLSEMASQLTDIAGTITEDGKACNLGLADACKLGVLAPADQVMTEVSRTSADESVLREALVERVIPAWVERCGQDCGERFNEVLAPLAGVSYERP